MYTLRHNPPVSYNCMLGIPVPLHARLTEARRPVPLCVGDFAYPRTSYIYMSFVYHLQEDRQIDHVPAGEISSRCGRYRRNHQCTTRTPGRHAHMYLVLGVLCYTRSDVCTFFFVHLRMPQILGSPVKNTMVVLQRKVDGQLLYKKEGEGV